MEIIQTILIEQFEPTVSQSTVSSPPLNIAARRALRVAREKEGATISSIIILIIIIIWSSSSSSICIIIDDY